MLSGGFAKVSFKPLNQESNNKKNQSWKVSSKREQNKVRFDSAEHKELRLMVIVSFGTGDWQASFSSCSRKVLGCFFIKSCSYF